MHREVTVEAVEQMGKQEMMSLLMLVCRKGDDIITPAFRDAMLLFGDEYQLTGAVMTRLREGSAKSTQEKDKEKDKAKP